MNTETLNQVMVAYADIADNPEKLREVVRHFLIKYPSEALIAINNDGKPIGPFILEGREISRTEVAVARQLYQDNRLVDAIKYIRAIGNPIFTLKGAKEFCERYCV